jgi:hypothetical protein
MVGLLNKIKKFASKGIKFVSKVLDNPLVQEIGSSVIEVATGKNIREGVKTASNVLNATNRFINNNDDESSDDENNDVETLAKLVKSVNPLSRSTRNLNNSSSRNSNPLSMSLSGSRNKVIGSKNRSLSSSSNDSLNSLIELNDTQPGIRIHPRNVTYGDDNLDDFRNYQDDIFN